MRKGVHYLLEAFSSLRLKNAELWLIGHIFDDLKESLKKHEGNYKIIGHIKNDDLHKYYSQGSVCVLPSLDDGFNKVMLEAMACGLPVIITANTGAGDVIDDNIDGFIIPIRDTESLKKKIMYMYENQNICEQMGQKAKDKIKQKFTIENYTERMLAACNGLLN
jgi:glycosyltransferase involved in cell wall biosynthesis